MRISRRARRAHDLHDTRRAQQLRVLADARPGDLASVNADHPPLQTPSHVNQREQAGDEQSRGGRRPASRPGEPRRRACLRRPLAGPASRRATVRAVSCARSRRSASSTSSGMMAKTSRPATVTTAAPSTRREATGPVTPSSARRFRTRSAPSTRSAGSRGTMAARNVMIVAVAEAGAWRTPRRARAGPAHLRVTPAAVAAVSGGDRVRGWRCRGLRARPCRPDAWALATPAPARQATSNAVADPDERIWKPWEGTSHAARSVRALTWRQASGACSASHHDARSVSGRPVMTGPCSQTDSAGGCS